MNDIPRFEFNKPTLTRPRELDARVAYTEWLNATTLKLAFEPVDTAMFPFEPGQYVSLVLPKDEAAGLRRELRPYSMWNHPDEFEYAVTVVRMVQGGRASELLQTIKEGAAVRIVGPLGHFYLRRPLHPHLYFVATGTGLVPLRSMIKELVSSGEIHEHDTTLLFGVRHEEDLFELDELQRWSERFPRFTFIPTLSKPGPDWTGATGRVTAHLAEWDLPVDTMQIYLCGNGAMIDDATALLKERGLDRRTRRVVYEKYFA